MEIVSTVKKQVLEPTGEIITGVPSALKDTFTTKKGATSWGTIVAGSVVGGLTAHLDFRSILPLPIWS